MLARSASAIAFALGLVGFALACSTSREVDETGEVGETSEPPLDEDEALPPLSPRPSTITCTMQGTPAHTLPRLQAEFVGVASFPAAVQLLPDPVGAGVLVVESSGRVWRVDVAGQVASEPWLDLASEVAAAPARGLLALALADGWIYAHLQPLAQPERSRVVRLPFDPASSSVALDGMLTMLELDAEGRGGALALDAEGHLLIGVGDRSGSLAQDRSELSGKLLRVAAPSEAIPGYAVPPDNPLLTDPDARPEIFALGLHDPRGLVVAGSAIWASELGLVRSEFGRVVASANLGWPITEGWQCVGPGDCDPTSFQGPRFDVTIAEPPHCELIAGAHVEGAMIPQLGGALVWSDRCSGRLWGLALESEGAASVEVLGSVETGVLALGRDLAGDPWLIDGEGRLARLRVDEHGEPGSLPVRLSETGCFEPDDPTTPKPELIPYLLSAPLWSDGLHKRRYMVVPPGEQIGVDVLGRWRFPTGSVLIKTFSLDPERPIETRMMVRRAGTWDFYTYRWRDDFSDADLLGAGETRELTIDDEPFTWEFPSQIGCQSCHGFGEGEALGPGTTQLNREVVYGELGVGPPREQLDALAELGLFLASPGPASAAPRMVDPRDEAAPLDQRARAYLHGNCAHCHLPTWMDPDLRWDTPFADTLACNHPTEFPSPDAGGELRIAPGEPERSNLWLRMITRGDDRMPPLGSGRSDARGHALIEAWILAMEGCE